VLGDLLMEIDGEMTSVTVAPPVPEGSQVEVEVAAETSGRVNGASLETHYVIIRPDGKTGHGEGHALINTADGEAIQVYYPWGMGRATSPGTFTVKGCITFSTVSADLEWLNDTLGVWEGIWDLADRKSRVSVYEWEYPEQ
jgi:predicted RNA-binding protein with TRAM domain